MTANYLSYIDIFCFQLGFTLVAVLPECLCLCLIAKLLDC